MAHAEELAIASCCFVDRRESASARAQADEESEIIGHDRGPDVSLEVVEAAPRAAAQAVGPLETGNARLDPGPEVAQLAIRPAAAHHVFDLEPALLVEGHVRYPTRLRSAQIVAAGKAAVRHRLTRRRPIRGDMALQHRHEPVAVGRVAGLDPDVEDQAAAAGAQVELVTVLDVALARVLGLDPRMMSACVSNRLTSLSRAGTASPRSTRRSLCAITVSTSGSYWWTLARQSATAGVVDAASRVATVRR